MNRFFYWQQIKLLQSPLLHCKLCEHLHVPRDFHDIEFSQTRGKLSMSFRKNVVRVERKRAMFGKNIIITDDVDWTTSEIVETSLDRWQVEAQFRISKDDDIVSMRPLRLWTDSKIRCHPFACMVAMTQLRRIELKLKAAGVDRTADDVMEDMRHLHSVLMLREGGRKAERRLEIPTKTHAEVLSAVGVFIDTGRVLRPLSR